MKMIFDEFEAWIRDRSRGCMEQHEIDAICAGDMDFETGEYTFLDPVTQGQWEAWQASANIVENVSRITVCHLPYQPAPFVHGCLQTPDGPRDVWLRNDGLWTTCESDARNALLLSDGWNPPAVIADATTERKEETK